MWHLTWVCTVTPVSPPRLMSNVKCHTKCQMSHVISPVFLRTSFFSDRCVFSCNWIVWNHGFGMLKIDHRGFFPETSGFDSMIFRIECQNLWIRRYNVKCNCLIKFDRINYVYTKKAVFWHFWTMDFIVLKLCQMQILSKLWGFERFIYFVYRVSNIKSSILDCLQLWEKFMH